MTNTVSDKQRGFTLVEIMIVILIIGMLLSIALPNFVRAREGAHAKACQKNLEAIFSAKERWAMDNSKGNADTPVVSDLVGTGKYIRTQPVCPGGGSYTINNVGTQPTCSVGGVQGESNAHVMP